MAYKTEPPCRGMLPLRRGHPWRNPCPPPLPPGRRPWLCCTCDNIQTDDVVLVLGLNKRPVHVHCGYRCHVGCSGRGRSLHRSRAVCRETARRLQKHGYLSCIVWCHCCRVEVAQLPVTRGGKGECRSESKVGWLVTLQNE